MGVVKFRPTGNYFGSVQTAVMYALKADMRNAVGTDEERIEMAEYMAKVESMLSDFQNALSASSGSAT